MLQTFPWALSRSLRALLFCLAIPVSCVSAQADKPRCAAAADKGACRQSARLATKARQPTRMRCLRLPADAHTQQSIQLDGKTLKYTVTVGALPTRDKDGKVAGEVVLTAYTVEGDNRPVTFALNGGPGASQVYLNFGAIGPKHLQAGNEGDSPSDPPVLTDNPGHVARFYRPGVH